MVGHQRKQQTMHHRKKQLQIKIIHRMHKQKRQ